MEEDEKYMIPIPGNIKIRMELIDGIGVKELVYIAVAGIISALFAYTLNAIISNYIISVGIFLAITALTFLFVRKDKYNQSFVGIFGNMIKFFAGQKYFKYEIEQVKIIKEDSGGNKDV